MTERITLTAPAKINLSLRILGRRPDGFHELETLMAPLCLADEVEVSHGVGTGIQFICNDPDLPSGSDNLCVKAAESFLENTGLVHGIALSLMKRIPHGAGLGGGSSDAAAVLRGLNELFDHPLVSEELHHIAATLGSDVPFFLGNGPALCRGRGEILESVDALPQRCLLLIKPPFPVSTAWAYRHHAEMQQSRPGIIQEKEQRMGRIKLVNDLEPAVFDKFILLPVMKGWLLQQAGVESAFMTGSGSTMVAIMEPDAAPGVVVKLREEFEASFGHTFRIAETQFHPLSA